MDSYKVVLLGGPSVGKSAIFRRLHENTFSNDSKATIAATYCDKTINVPGYKEPVRINLWDTAGSERFKAINQIYYRDAAAALVVYDITRSGTLHDEAAQWINDLKESAPAHLTIAITGNKCDLYDKQEVPVSEL